MRSRKPFDAAVDGPTDVDPVAASSAARRVSPTPSPKDPAAGMSAAARRSRAELDPNNTDMCNAYARLLQKEADDELRQGPLWRLRCSSSVFVGLLIWAIIGLIVYVKINSAEGEGRGIRGGGAVNAPAAVTASPTLVETPAAALPEGCRGAYCLEDGGSEPFGAVLGSHNGVFAYSNCYSHTCASMLDYQIELPLPAYTQPKQGTGADAPAAKTQMMTTGMKWQCVEYARRYWMLRGTPAPAAFGSVVGAADIWGELAHVTLLDGVTTAPLLKFANGARLGYGGSAPRVGDLLIYPRDTDGVFPYGHVAVVVGVELSLDAAAAAVNASQTAEAPRTRHGLVFIAEQNWHSAPWPAPYHNYSRALPLTVAVTPRGLPVQYTIEDTYHPVQGWVRYDNTP